MKTPKSKANKRNLPTGVAVQRRVRPQVEADDLAARTYYPFSLAKDDKVTWWGRQLKYYRQPCPPIDITAEYDPNFVA